MSRKTAIITGASTGIGEAIALKFHNAGYNLVINSMNEDNLLRAYEEMGAPDNVHPVAGDVSDPRVGEALSEAAEREFGGIDVLVNNAGVFGPQAFLEVAEADLDKFLTTNLKGTFFTTQAAVRRMQRAGNGGSVINLGTVLVDHAIGGFPATAPLVSKGAIHALTRQLAAEFAPDQIRVNAIAPGVIRSAMQAKIGVEDADSLAGLHLLNRIGEPEEIAETALFLAENTFVTGEIVNVDGGHTAGHAIA
ncbi:MAG: SDR family oxidoreductase [Acidobacteriota bacterium]|nr:MAG: SDR family oxidoreductase [Acidobacteriota bacterium]